MRRIDKNLYKYAAEAIRGYQGDALRREMLREFLEVPPGRDLDVPGLSEGVGISPQEAAFDRIWKSAEYRRLTLRISCMEKLNAMLTNDESRILHLVLEELTWKQIAAVTDRSEESCRKSVWPRIVRKAVRLLFGDLA